ncbi:MFS general substrate transporter [Dentipellis sp. KUC8613]|nr:MFS general substrate transporter [Dentipellis sp. KUC8613]
MSEAEESPLLGTTPPAPYGSADERVQEEAIEHDAVYKRFKPAKKRVIVALVSWAGLLPLFVSGSFVPSIPEVAREFDSTGPIINLAVSLSIFAVALGTLVWATYSGFYGRRPIYLVSTPVLALGSLGVSLSRSVPELMVWRFVQAFGSGSGMSVGGGVIGDIYRLEERGSVMGIFFAFCLTGPALAPLAGGLATHYASWRVMQFALFVAAIIAYLLMFFFLPETSQPHARGVDKLDRWRWVWLNPFRSMMWFRSPNLLLLCLVGSFVLITDYVLLIPLAYTVGKRYDITNEALIGAFFLPAGLGNIIGAPLAGRISDIIVVRWRKKRGGVWVPEDRLRGTMVGALVFVPMSVLLCGIITHYVDGRAGVVLNLICLFFNGIGVDLVLSPMAAYLVDIMHSRSAEAMASNAGLRSIFTALATAAILPSINTFGVLATDAMAAGLAWIGCLLMWATIRYGDRMRAWVDVGFSTAANN